MLIAITCRMRSSTKEYESAQQSRCTTYGGIAQVLAVGTHRVHVHIYARKTCKRNREDARMGAARSRRIETYDRVNIIECITPINHNSPYVIRVTDYVIGRAAIVTLSKKSRILTSAINGFAPRFPSGGKAIGGVGRRACAAPGKNRNK